MWAVYGQSLKMVKDDYGIELPVVIDGTTIMASDEIRFTVKNAVTNTVILEKTFANIENNTVNLVLTEEESAEFNVGDYHYSLDWYQNNVFMCNIIPNALFSVVNKI